jgi:hypothetical protein
MPSRLRCACHWVSSAKCRQGASASLAISDHVVAVPGPQQIEEVQPALAGGGGKPGEMVVADLRADAVCRAVPGTRVIDADPRTRRKTGPKHVTGFIEKAVLAGDQQAHHLTVRDIDPDGIQLCRHPPHGDLALVMLGQNKTAQLRSKVAADTGRQRRRHRLSVCHKPTLTPVAHDVRAKHQILHHKVLVALEA